MMKSNLKKDYFWNTIGVFAQNVISPLLLVVITRINGIYDSGLFSFAFSVSVIFLALGMWGGRTFQVSDSRKEFSTESYLTVRIILSFVMIFAAFVFSLANNYDTLKTTIILGLVFTKVFETISDALYATMQVNKKLYISGRSLTYKAVLSILLFVSLDLFTGSLLAGVVGLIAANLLIVMFYDIPKLLTMERNIFRSSTLRSSTLEALKVMRRSLPVFAVTFLAMFSLNIPRYFLDMNHPDQIGFFGILAMPITLITLAISFLIQPNVVHLSELFRDGRHKEFNKIIRNLLMAASFVGLMAVVGAYLFGVPVLNFVFGIDFERYMFALIIIIIGATVNAVVAIYMTIMVIMRAFKIPFFIYLVTNVFLAFASILYIKEYGLDGSVMLFTIANVSQAILFAFYYRIRVRSH